jgi:hypothetical protein
MDKFFRIIKTNAGINEGLLNLTLVCIRAINLII